MWNTHKGPLENTGKETLRSVENMQSTIPISEEKTTKDQ
jgi:hypothetical protein